MGRGDQRRVTWSAAEHYRKACAITPNFGASHYALALAYRDLARQGKHRASLLYQKDKLGWPSLDDPLLDAGSSCTPEPHHYLKQGVTWKQLDT
jgi:hypothetical protein